MAMAMAALAGASLLKKLLFPLTPPLASSKFLNLNLCRCLPSSAAVATRNFSATTAASTPTRIRKNKNKKKKEQKEKQSNASSTSRRAAEALVKRRTRSEIEFDEETVLRFGDSGTHIPVMLGEVLEVFASVPLRSFVDCTLGAAGHSSAVIQAHREMQSYIGLDVDPVAHEKARAQINVVLQGCSCDLPSSLKVHTLLKNFKDIKPALCEVDEKILVPGVDGILMDLGMSSMQVNSAERGFSVLSNGPLDMRMNPQASLKAEDILNLWPDTEVGRILREYGEENNWRSLQRKVVNARLSGGLHSTGQLVDLIRSSTFKTKGGRQGWIKTATRVFQALRIAVNDELKTLEDSLYNCFDCLAPGGRLAVISFHSLEDRIVKQTFLNIINSNVGDGHGDEKEESCFEDSSKISFDKDRKEAWIKQTIYGPNARILTKRPITPSEEEEKLNCRSRSAKLRVIQKARK
ncbi:hypothetical protein RJ639_020942 [Escallonia herrerae]|uniref:Uncharacterized protein n=1 Tax=Escallonia herrerae TaxID=1293975 RepID=A0AA88V3I7_9ASTE|nr:hypothetical protein RJ639_020942 [Escallonia herrerae]